VTEVLCILIVLSPFVLLIAFCIAVDVIKKGTWRRPVSDINVWYWLEGFGLERIDLRSDWPEVNKTDVWWVMNRLAHSYLV
jgi:hypothetical protein